MAMVKRKRLKRVKPPTQCRECFAAGLAVVQSRAYCERCKSLASKGKS
jgi:hypothetical protein